MKDKRFEVWCELVHWLDRKSLSSVKTAKPNGAQPWELLQECFKSRERPRIHHFLNKLTNLRMNSLESMLDYLIRAEKLQLNLIDVAETVSDQMLTDKMFGSFESVAEPFCKFRYCFQFFP